ncbi:MAG: hypothetical protein A3I66_14995 [Burkholderiales bacterium RIFCSPLOWO2_02_FULL_57_36]|nr:MAG: hypothetical protein A3I66_14995 [Burkholderiales bacterium RIFCSPLOWO2_02_FULL_57_36]
MPHYRKLKAAYRFFGNAKTVAEHIFVGYMGEAARHGDTTLPDFSFLFLNISQYFTRILDQHGKCARAGTYKSCKQ